MGISTYLCIQTGIRCNASLGLLQNFDMPIGMAPLETVWKTTGTWMAADWTSHLSADVFHRITLNSQINSKRALPPVEPVGNSNSYWSSLREEWSWITFQISMKYTLQFWYNWCCGSYGNLLRSRQCSFRKNSDFSNWFSHLNHARTPTLIGHWLVWWPCGLPQMHSFKTNAGWINKIARSRDHPAVS